MSTVEKIEYKGYEIEVWRDMDTDIFDPEKNYTKEELMLVSFHSNYGNHHGFSEPEEVIEYAKDKKMYIYPVFMYEHSGVAFSLSDFGDRWDSGQYGFLLIRKKDYKSKKQADKFAQSWIKEYSARANGEIYGFTVNSSDGEMIESIGGYVGDYNYAVEEAKDIIDNHIKKTKGKYFSKMKAQIKARVPLEKREAYPFESGTSGFSVLPAHKQKYMTVMKGKHKGERIKLYLEGKIGKQDYILAKWRGAGYLKIKNKFGEASESADQTSPIIRESVGNPFKYKATGKIRNPVRQFTLRELKSKPTIESGHFDNLKMADDHTRVWLSRMTVADGMPYNNQVTVEKYIDGNWKTVSKYQAR